MLKNVAVTGCLRHHHGEIAALVFPRYFLLDIFLGVSNRFQNVR
jgi:hypothetical protein